MVCKSCALYKTVPWYSVNNMKLSTIFPNNSLTKTLSVNHIPNSMKNNKFIGMNWSIIDWFSVDGAILFFSEF